MTHVHYRRATLGTLLALALLSCLWGCSDDTVNPAARWESESNDYWPASRLAWSRAAAPQVAADPAWVAATGDDRVFAPDDRAETRWFLPRERVLSRYLYPGLEGEDRDATIQTLELYLRADQGWERGTWGGIERGLPALERGRLPGIDLTAAGITELEIWVNDFTPDPALRRGVLHFDFGILSEDFFWPETELGGLETGTWQREDGIDGSEPDGVWTYQEDIGLDGDEDGRERYGAEYEIDGDSPFPRINGTARNNREDSEDLDGDHSLNLEESFFSLALDLAETPADIDVVVDYAATEPAAVAELIDQGIAWRRYVLPLAEARSVSPQPPGDIPDPTLVTHLRIWFEDDGLGAPASRSLQLSHVRFRTAD